MGDEQDPIFVSTARVVPPEGGLPRDGMWPLSALSSSRTRISFFSMVVLAAAFAATTLLWMHQYPFAESVDLLLTGSLGRWPVDEHHDLGKAIIGFWNVFSSTWRMYLHDASLFRAVDSFWLGALLASVGCSVTWFCMRRNARPYAVLTGCVLLMLVSTILGPAAIYIGAAKVGIPRLFLFTTQKALIAGVLMALPLLLHVSRWDRQRKPSTTVYGSLPFKFLPLGLLRNISPSVDYGQEVAVPAEGIAPRKFELIDGIIWLLQESKGVGDIQFWRASSETDERLLILVDRRVGFGRHTWCLLHLSQPGSGTDLSIKMTPMTPRYVDWMDWTLLRPIAFPAFIVANVFGAAHAKNEDLTLSCSLILWTISGTFVTALIGMVSCVGVAVALCIFVVGLTLAYLAYLFEANPPNQYMKRASQELVQMLHPTIMTALIPLRSSG